MLAHLARRSFSGLTNKPVNVLVTGATGGIGYNLAFRIADGRMFGPHQPVNLKLYARHRELDPPEECRSDLLGVKMELQDSWFPLLESVTSTTSLEEACEGVDFACLIGSVPRGPGMERNDLLSLNGIIFKQVGQTLSKYASPNCKTVVVGNPANTNCLIAIHNAPNIPPENFSALTRLDHNRAWYQIAKKAGVRPKEVSHFCIWGNHSPTMFPDIQHCEIEGKPFIGGHIESNDPWIENFYQEVQSRGAKVIGARGVSSSASAAAAVVDHIRDWATASNGWVSMGIISDDAYNLEPGFVYSYPVITYEGKWNKVGGLAVSDRAAQLMKNSLKELKTERDAVRHLLN